jgi:hypothetical protein
MKNKKAPNTKKGVLKFIKATGKFVVGNYELCAGDVVLIFLPVPEEKELMAYETEVNLDSQNRWMFSEIGELASNFVGCLVLVMS